MAEGKNVGYRRVSSVEQNTDRQLVDVPLDKVFEDKASGKDMERPSLQACLEYVRENDVLWVSSIDRLARNLGDLEKIVQALTAKGVSVKFVKENLTFSGDKEDAMARLMFQLLGAVGQFERSLIRERQQSGIAAAKRRNVIFGRPEKLTPTQKEELRARAVFGEPKEALAKEYGISKPTLYGILKQAS